MNDVQGLHYTDHIRIILEVPRSPPPFEVADVRRTAYRAEGHEGATYLEVVGRVTGMQAIAGGCLGDQLRNQFGIEADTVRSGLAVSAGSLEDGQGFGMKKIHADLSQDLQGGLMDRFQGLFIDEVQWSQIVFELAPGKLPDPACPSTRPAAFASPALFLLFHSCLPQWLGSRARYAIYTLWRHRLYTRASGCSGRSVRALPEGEVGAGAAVVGHACQPAPTSGGRQHQRSTAFRIALNPQAGAIGLGKPVKSEYFGRRPAHQQAPLCQQVKAIRIEPRQVEVVEDGNHSVAGRRQTPRRDHQRTLVLQIQIVGGLVQQQIARPARAGRPKLRQHSRKLDTLPFAPRQLGIAALFEALQPGLGERPA